MDDPLGDPPPDVAVEAPNVSTEPAEPALTTGGLVAFATLVINGLVLFGGLKLTGDEKLYLIGAVTFLAPLLTGLWIRFKVWSPKTVDLLGQEYRQRVIGQQRKLDAAQAQVAAVQGAMAAVQVSIPSVVAAVAHELRPQPVPMLGFPGGPPPSPPPPLLRVREPEHGPITSDPANRSQEATQAFPSSPSGYVPPDERFARRDEQRPRHQLDQS